MTQRLLTALPVCSITTGTERNTMNKLLASLSFGVGLFTTACQQPSVDSSDLSISCEIDDDCRVATQEPCTAAPCLCEGIPLNQEAFDEYNRRLAAADEQCIGDDGLCSPCESYQRTPRCEAGSCIAAPGQPD